MKKSKQYYKSKEFKQYSLLAQRFRITQVEFAEYYKRIRLAKKKAGRLKKSNTAIYIPNYTLSVSGIKTRKDFNKRVENINKFLLPEYTMIKNNELRENLYETLRNLYGESAEPIIEKLSEMDAKTYIQFFKDNPDLKFIEYYPEDSSEFLTLINETVEKFKGRLGI